MENLQFGFYIMIEPNGRQWPIIRVGLGKFSALNGLAASFDESQKVEQSLNEIRKVMSGENEYYLLQNSDVAVVEVYRVESIVRDDMAFAKPERCSTRAIENLIEKWCDFLILYESGMIPNIIPNSKKDKWKIVPTER